MSRKITVEIIASLLVLLFVYAALSKLLDYSNFKFQLGREPIIKDYAGTLLWLIPFSEILTVFLLLFPGSRKMGLIASSVLMILFTFYIGLMLASGEHLPCSCGGFLQHLSWKSHFIFNLTFLSITIIGMLLEFQNISPDKQGNDVDQHFLTPH